MKSFGFGDVRLLDGMMKRAMDEMIDYYRAIDVDSMFQYLRRDAGLPAPGKDFSGWYPESRGVMMLGQWLSAHCRIYAITGEQRDRERTVLLMKEFWRLHDMLQHTDKPVFDRRTFYSLEKILTAVLDYKECLGISLDERARFLVDFAHREFESSRLFGDNGTEWYIIGEAFYRAAEAFGLPQALEVAKKFEYRQWWDLFALGRDPYAIRPQGGMYSEYCHAYSHVNSFNSAAMAYRHTGDEYYLTTIKNFYRFMLDEQVMCTGGYGAEYEHIMPKDRLVQALRSGHDSFETQCDTYAVYRLMRQMTELLGDAEYSDWVERLIFNATLATIPMTPEGNVLYYSDYNMDDACKKNRVHAWTCCTGTRPLLMCELPKLLYFHDNANLYVAQYAPSSVDWECAGRKITLEQGTDFPYADRVTFTLHTSGSAEFTLNLRAPQWLAGPAVVEVNCRRITPQGTGKGWLCINRAWADGDQLVLTLPQNLWMHALDKARNAPNAFLHGPVALAAKYDDGRKPIPATLVRSFVERMRPVDGHPLHYDVEGVGHIHFKPFLEFEELEHYSLYFDTGVHATDTIPIY